MNLGVMGIGYWGKKVLKEYNNLLEKKQIDSLMIYDASSDVRNYVADNFPRVKVLESEIELLGSIDALHLCTPNESHFDFLLEASNMHIDTLVEKPLTTSSNTSFIAIERFLSEGLILQVGNIYRFTNVLPIVKSKLIREIGKIRYINIDWSHKAASLNSLKSDVRWDLLPHILDILNSLTDRWPISVSHCENLRLTADSPPSATSLGLIFEGGIEANIRLSLISDITRRDIEIIGENGSIQVNPTLQKLKFYHGGLAEELEVQQNNTILTEIENFLTCIRTRKNIFNSANLGAYVVREIENIVREFK